MMIKPAYLDSRLLKYCLLFALGLLCSCSRNEMKQQEEAQQQQTSKRARSAIRAIPDDSLHFHAFRIKAGEAPARRSNFTSLDQFPTTWVGLRQNALGLFVYQRYRKFYDCLSIANDSLHNGGYGETVSWPIRDFRPGKGEEYYFALGSATSGQTYARCTITILDRDTMYAIQTSSVLTRDSLGNERVLGEFRGLFVPDFKAHLFYHIEEPHRRSPERRVPFKDVDIEQFRKSRSGAGTGTTKSGELSKQGRAE